MLEAYSKNITIPANSSAPFTNVSLIKGNTSEMQGDATILFNKCGVYRVSFNASVIASEAGEISFQLFKNSMPQTQAEVSETAADATSIHALNFETLVQVPKSNSGCPCSIPTVISVNNTGVAVIGDVHIIVDKIV
jgi:hypothetical protein